MTAQWTFTELPCKECETKPRIKGGTLCATCSVLCSRCRIAPKTAGHGWCSACRSERRKEMGWRSDPARDAVLAAVRRALQSGAIQKTPCVICGKTAVLPFIEDVMQRPPEPEWYCKQHHRLRCLAVSDAWE